MFAHENPDPAPPRHYRRWLAGILIGGLALRLVGIDFGLPYVDARPDERNIIIRAITLLLGDPNPHYFNYPSGGFYLVAGVLGGEGLVAVAWGYAKSVREYLAGFFLDPTVCVVTARLLSVVASTATIAVTYGLGRRLANPRVGLLGALAIAGCFLAVRDAHFGATDSLLMLFIALSASSILHAGQTRTIGSAMRAGVLAGLALGIKYNAALLLAPMVIAFLFTHRLTFRPSFRCLGAAVAAMAGAFAITSPYALLDWPAFWRDLTFEMDHLAAGHAVVGARGWWTHFSASLWYGLGVPLLAASLIGLVIRLGKPSVTDLVVFSFPLLYYAGIGKGHTTFARYMLPVLPFACVAGACAVDGFLARWARSEGRRLALGAAAMMLLLTPSLVRAVQFDWLLTRTDTRASLATWWLEHLPAKTTVAWIGSPWGIPLLYDSIDEPSLRGWLPPAGRWRNDVARLRAERSQPVYRVRWLGLDVERIRTALASHPAEVVVVETGALVGYTLPADAVSDLLPAERYERRFAIDPARRDGPVATYDQQDAFFIPLAGLGAIERPGPALTVFRRKP